MRVPRIAVLPTAHSWALADIHLIPPRDNVSPPYGHLPPKKECARKGFPETPDWAVQSFDGATHDACI